MTFAPRTWSAVVCTAIWRLPPTAGQGTFCELLLVPGVGARTVRALAMVAEVVHGTPYRFSDPARFSIAHGGKDRHPYPMPLKVYDRTIEVMKRAVRQAKLGHSEELAALKRLDDQARRLERDASGPSFEALLAEERVHSHEYGGRSVFGDEPPPGVSEVGSRVQTPTASVADKRHVKRLYVQCRALIEPIEVLPACFTTGWPSLSTSPRTRRLTSLRWGRPNQR
jgi:hypothetical protein